MNKLSTDRRAALISALVEGNSVRATARMTDRAFNTVLRFVVDIGTVCRAYLDEHMRNLTCRRLQADEIWQFCYAKDKNLPDSMRGKPGVGSVWTWIAIDADTKLVPTFHVGTRDAGCAHEFLTDLASRLRNRVQLTTDGHRAYLTAVDFAFAKSGTGCVSAAHFFRGRPTAFLAALVLSSISRCVLLTATSRVFSSLTMASIRCGARESSLPLSNSPLPARHHRSATEPSSPLQ